MKQEYLNFLINCYLDELFGIGLFEGLRDNANDEDERMKWQVLADLERFVASKIIEELRNHDVDESAISKCNIEKKTKKLLSKWTCLNYADIIEELIVLVVPYIERFSLALKYSCFDKSDILNLILKHEEAICDFAIQEKRSFS